MTKAEFASAMRQSFVPEYLTVYPKFKVRIETLLRQSEEGLLGAHGWANFITVVNTFSIVKGLPMNGLISYMKEQMQACELSGNVA